MRAIKGYRFVKDDMTSQSGHTEWEIGKWNKHEGEIELCASGFHACKTPYQSIHNIYGNRWFLCEARGKIIHDKDKFVASEMRLVKEISETVSQWFALACARRALKYYTKKYPDDNRVAVCLDANENYLNNPTPENLKKLQDAAYAANAAYAAANAAYAAAYAANAANAAYAAANAADAAADAAEIKWQKNILNRLVKTAPKKEAGI